MADRNKQNTQTEKRNSATKQSKQNKRQTDNGRTKKEKKKRKRVQPNAQRQTQKYTRTYGVGETGVKRLLETKDQPVVVVERSESAQAERNRPQLF
jgi:hypothetical protein